MPWTRKRTSPSAARFLLEDADELLAHDLALLLGVGDAGEPREEALLRLHVDERDVEVAAERLHDLLGLVLAQQAVIDEDAGELVADRLVHEERGNGRVDAARERAEHALRADRRADPRDLLLDDRGGRPRRRRAGDLVEEVLEDVLPVRRVHDLGMELHAVQPRARSSKAAIGVEGELAVTSRPRRWSRHGVAMAHPHGLLGREVVEELGVARLELGLAELGGSRALDGAAEVARHELHAVTDAERRDPEREDLRVELRRAVGVDRRRAAGEDQRRRVRAWPPRRPRAGARRAPSTPAPRAPAVRSAGCTGRRGRRRGRDVLPVWPRESGAERPSPSQRR